ncbi:hypothetical protein GF325_14020 [Candidatus Bathyarchaeota archaeon]|nr:hypothetical protein [Candidatus Bathyarchaeota archaeon]
MVNDSKRCAYCNKLMAFGFRCSHCNKRFCVRHRLPEKHECPGLQDVTSPI